MSEASDTPQPSQITTDSVGAREHSRRVIDAGGILAFRTDTFYGLGADPFNPAAVARINRMKEREGKKPVLVVVSAREATERFIFEQSDLFKELTKHYWPGPLTIVCRALPSVPVEITAGSGSVGLRLPLDAEVQEFISACGGTLTATSANPPGEPPARSALQVAQYFPNELDLIVDSGIAKADKPSTVIDVSHGPALRLIREGEIARSDLERTLGSLGIKLT